MFVCVAAGLWGGLAIGLVTEYYTSNHYTPVQDVADSCRTGAATDIIFGLALGYKSTIVPCLVIAAAIFTGFTLGNMYGIACAALGMLATLATCLAIDAYGPISDNAGGIAEMAAMGEDIRERTDALDAAGNTTAAIGKGFAIGSAALVSLALFGAYVTRAGITVADSSILDPRVFSGLLVGAMLPYWFSAMTMKSVGKAALAMVEEVRRQFNTIPGARAAAGLLFFTGLFFPVLVGAVGSGVGGCCLGGEAHAGGRARGSRCAVRSPHCSPFGHSLLPPSLPPPRKKPHPAAPPQPHPQPLTPLPPLQV
jgi:inorganic pyrophosphatase